MCWVERFSLIANVFVVIVNSFVWVSLSINVKPDSINASEILQQTLTPIKKKESDKKIEVKENRLEAPVVEQFAPVPMSVSMGE